MSLSPSWSSFPWHNSFYLHPLPMGRGVSLPCAWSSEGHSGNPRALDVCFLLGDLGGGLWWARGCFLRVGLQNCALWQVSAAIQAMVTPLGWALALFCALSCVGWLTAAPPAWQEEMFSVDSDTAIWGHLTKQNTWLDGLPRAPWHQITLQLQRKCCSIAWLTWLECSFPLWFWRKDKRAHNKLLFSCESYPLSGSCSMFRS